MSLESELALFHRIVGVAQQRCSAFRCGEPAVVDEFLPDIDGTGLGGWLYWCKTHQAEKLAMIEGAQQQFGDGQCSTVDEILDEIPREVDVGKLRSTGDACPKCGTGCIRWVEEVVAGEDVPPPARQFWQCIDCEWFEEIPRRERRIPGGPWGVEN